MDGAVLTLRGKLFQERGEATPNALDAIIVLVLGSVSFIRRTQRFGWLIVCDQIVKISWFPMRTHFVCHH